mgnify:CR=1 FL=1
MILPPLNALRFFDTAARRGSFSVAAAELHVTPGAVSQQIHLLEDRLGVPLFDRTARGVMLTEAGRRYASELRTIFESLERATEEVIAPTRQTLVIAVTPRFASKWLFPKLPEFQQANPHIEVELRPSLSPVDFARDQVDVAFRHGSGHWEGVEAHFLLSEELIPVCSHSLCQGPQAIRTAEDLRHHRLLHITPAMGEWGDWLAAAGATHPDSAGGIKLESLRVALDLAAAGLGVALGRLPFVSDELESGQLVAPLDLRIPSKNSYYLIYPSEWKNRPKVRTFTQWILKHTVSPSAETTAQEFQ